MDFLPKQDKRYLSFLISDSEIKVAKIKEEKGKKSLAFYLECPIPAGLIVAGEVKDSEKLAKLLLDLKSKIKIEENFVVVGLSEIKATTRTLLLPHLALEEIDQAVKFQADSFLPFSYENEYVDWMFFGVKKNGKIKLLVSAIPRNIIDSYVSSFEKAGLLPIAFEPRSLSLLRFISPEERKSSLVIEIAEVMTILVINKDGDLEMSSVVLDKDQYLPTIEKIDEYYFKGRKEKGVELKVYLCGKNVNSQICEQIKSLKAKTILLKSGIEGVPVSKETELVVLLWLAQKQVAPPRDEKTINILPSALDERYKIAIEKKAEKKLNYLTLSILVFLNLVLFFSIFQTKVSTDRLLGRLGEEKDTIKIIQELGKYKEKAVFINRVSSRAEVLEKILGEIWQSNTDIVNLSGFTFSEKDREIVFTGWAATRDDLLKYRDDLEKMKIFSKVLLPVSSLEKGNNLDFRVVLTLP